MYLFAIIDVYTRYVVGWSVSNTITAPWWVRCLRRPSSVTEARGLSTATKAANSPRLSISSFSKATTLPSTWTPAAGFLSTSKLNTSSALKQEYVYLNPCDTGDELRCGLNDYFRFYNEERFRQSLGYRTPASFYTPHKEAA